MFFDLEGVATADALSFEGGVSEDEGDGLRRQMLLQFLATLTCLGTGLILK